MILSKHEIVRYLTEGRLVITPEIPHDEIDQVSIDLRLGTQFAVFKELPDHFPCIRATRSIFEADDLWLRYDQESFTLKPGRLVLARTLETVNIPGDLVGLVEGRSSWARLGISIHITAPKIDPGFRGPIALEMANLGNASVELRAHEDKPAQLMLARVSGTLADRDLYGAGDGDLFQDQAGPLPGRSDG